MTRRSLALFALSLSACASSPSAPPSEPAGPGSTAPAATPEELTAPVGHLELGEVSLVEGGRQRLVLRKDGSVYELPAEKELGKLGVDGRFVSPDGKTLAELTADGEIVTGKGDYLPVTIDSSGAVRLLKENRVIRVKDDGALDGANPGGPAVRFDGVTPKTRRAAMFLLVLASYPVRPEQ